MANNLLSTPWAGVPLTDDLPGVMNVMEIQHDRGWAVGRKSIRRAFQGGAGPWTATQILTSLIQDSGLFDPLSRRFGGIVTTTGTGTVAIDEGASFIDRVQVSIADQNIEDVPFAAACANAQMSVAGVESWYNTAGSFANCYKFNPALAITNTTAVAITPAVGTAITAVGSTPYKGDFKSAAVAASLRHKQGLPVDIPFGLLAPSHRCRTLWPLSVLNRMTTSITLATTANAIYQPANTDGAYTFNNVYEEYDIVQPSQDYAELLQELAHASDKTGIIIPIETLSVSRSLPWASAGGLNVFTVNRATNNLRKALVYLSPTAGNNNLAYPYTSCFPCEAVANVQFKVGSYSFPEQPADNLARIFFMTQGAFGQPENGFGGLANLPLYGITTNATSGVVAGLSGTGAVAQLALGDSWVCGYGFDALKGTKPSDAGGISLSALNGASIEIDVMNVAVESVQPTAMLFATRYIRVKDGAVKIEG